MSTSIVEGAETRASTYILDDQSAPAIANLADGGFVIAWQSPQEPADFANPGLPPGVDIYLQRYAADGSTLGGETHVNTMPINDQVDPVIAALPDGGFTVAWALQAEQAGSEHSVYFQRFDAAGHRVGDIGHLAGIVGSVLPLEPGLFG